MSNRPHPIKNAPETYKRMKALSDHVQESGIEKSLLELVKIRASQINGCAFCLDLHAREARKLGESDERMLLLSAWRDANVFSDREKAALGWTEAVTKLASAPPSAAAYEAARAQFSEQEIVDLTWAISVINTWNRMLASFEVPPMKAAAKQAAE